MPHIDLDDTIAAIATPLGEGGISVIRLSGSGCFPVLAKIFKPVKGKLEDYLSHTIHLGAVMSGEAPSESKMIDQVLVSVFRAPHSYTGQDVLEISSHGGLRVTKSILDLLIRAGARHAEPGEFTKRAFLNGKMDLPQAEAVLDLIKAKSGKSLEIAARQLRGTLSQKFQSLKGEMMKMYAHLEAFLDFPEEDLEIYEDKVFAEKYTALLSEMESLNAGFGRGALIREGALIAIVGKPNVGKSSLFNALLARDRALVCEQPGTTRDALEEALEIGGIYFRLVDTAGLSSSLEKGTPADALGMEKTRDVLKYADAFFYVVDGSAPMDEADRSVFREIESILREKETQKPFLSLINKSDLPQRLDLKDLESLTERREFFEISSKTRSGFDALEKKLVQIFSSESQESEQITRLRHKNALEEALEALKHSWEAFLRRDSLEYAAADLKRAIDVLRELVGEVYSEDLLDVIFSEFCIGK